jgi:hypothetical protein
MITNKEKADSDNAKTGMAKIVTNGNCCICEKPLDSGLFLCKKCASHTVNRRKAMGAKKEEDHE